MFDTHLSVGHARAGVGHPVRAAHGSPDHGAGSVSSSSLSLSGAHGLEALVVARNLLPKRVALLGRVVLAALAPVKLRGGIAHGAEDRDQDQHLARHCCLLLGSTWTDG